MVRRIVSYGERAAIADTIRFKFDELEGQTPAAGVYTGKIVIPAYSIILDIVVAQMALWNAGTSANLIVGDDDDDNGFYSGIDMKATDLLAGESLSFSYDGTSADSGAYLDDTSTHVLGRISSVERTITATLTTVGTVPTTGETFVTVVHSPSIGNTRKAVFTAT